MLRDAQARGLLALLLCACGAGEGPSDAGADAPARDAPARPCTFVDDGPAERLDTPPPHTPRWAFAPWISKDISSRDDSFAFVDGFLERDIPVGVLVIDSPWETNYNTFVPSPERYPDFEQMVSDLRRRGVRVVLWVTQMVNTTSFDAEEGGDVYRTPAANFGEGHACGFFVNGGATYAWWKGTGAGVDFFHPGARAWWHRQQDALLDLGVAGWKLDFGEQYITSPAIRTAAGDVTLQTYSEAYYEDFYRYGAHRSGTDEFVTMARPYDRSYGFEGRFFARPEHASVFWVGDNRRDWVGLIDALDHMFRSARAGYAVIGSDVGGYLDRDDEALTRRVPSSQATFARWTAIGALSPFMQLHGRANLTPWTIEERPDETVELYRYWATLHRELVPFFYALAEAAHAGGEGIMRPIGEEPEWPGDYRYLLGEAFLVAPILDDTGRRDVRLPEGARWYDFFDEDSDPVEGGSLLVAYDATDRRRIPLFVREGAIVPAEVRTGLTGLGDVASEGLLTVLVYPGPTPARLVHLEESATGDVPLTIEAGLDGGDALVTFDGPRRGIVLRVRSDRGAAGVTLDDAPLPPHGSRALLGAASEGFFHDSATRTTWVRARAATAPSAVRVIAP